MSEIEELLYTKLCKYCPYQRNCHDNCTTCDKYEEERERMENEQK